MEGLAVGLLTRDEQRGLRAGECTLLAMSTNPFDPSNFEPLIEYVQGEVVTLETPEPKIDGRHYKKLMPSPISDVGEERQLVAVAALAQEELTRALSVLTHRQQYFLRMRAMADTDAYARHIAGYPRNPSRSPGESSDTPGLVNTRPCGCAMHTPGWQDMREATLFEWKKQPAFMLAYQALLQSPIIFAATRLEQIAPLAVKTLEEIMLGQHGAKASDRRQAAKIVLESDGLLQVQGTNGGKPQAGTQESIQSRVIAERARRGLALPVSQQAQGQLSGPATLEEDPSRYLP